MAIDSKKTSGEEFRNRSEGARKGWLKRAREITKDTVGLAGNTLSKAALTLTRPDLVSSQKIADLKRRAREDATFITDESLTAGTLALLLLTKKGRALTKNTLIRTAKGAKGFAKEGFGDVPGKLFKQLRRKSNKVDKVATVIEDISPAASPVSKVLSKGYKDVKATTEVIKKAQQEVSEVVEAARSPSIREGRKVAGKLEVEELDKNNPAAEGWSVWERLRWRGKRDRAQIKSWIGLSKYSDNFWIKFNSRKAANIEFSSNRKPMSEATKRKISKSVARSKGRTAGYDTNKVNVSVNNSQGNFIDNGIESIGKLTKAISPILRYMNERENIAERKKRRNLQAINTAIYGVGTGSRVLSTAGSGRLARERLISKERLIEKQINARQNLESLKAQNRIDVENIKLGPKIMTAKAYERQPRMTAASILTHPDRIVPGEVRSILMDVLRGKA